jgi:hypothetical protein
LNDRVAHLSGVLVGKDVVITEHAQLAILQHDEATQSPGTA